MADAEELLRGAFASIADADATIGGITGRATLNLVELENLGKVPLPVITMLLVGMEDVGGAGDTWETAWQFDAYAQETDEGDQDAGLVCSNLLNALQAALTWTALDAASVDAVPSRPRARRREIGSGAGQLRRKILELSFRISP